jgi:hypothetical protein
MCLLGFAATLVHLARRDAPTYDEPLHFAAGVKAFFEGELSVDPMHPPTLRTIGVAFAALLGFEPPINLPGAKGNDLVILGSSLLGASGDRDLFIVRVTVITIVIITAWILFRSLRGLFGPKPSLLILALWSTCPTLLAHAHLFTLDAAPASLIVLAFVLHLQAARNDSAPTLAWLTLGLAVAGKASLLPFFPIMFVLTTLHAVTGRFKKRLGAVVLGPLLALVLIWIPYIVLQLKIPLGPPATPTTSRLGQLLSLLPLLPSDLSTGLVGGVSLYKPNAFLLGESYSGGLWYYFPVAIALKTQVSVLGASVVAAVVLVRNRPPGVLSHFVMPAIAYLAFLAAGDLNIGIRHALVVILFTLTATGSSLAVAGLKVKILITCLAFVGAAETAIQLPHSISFSNVVAGGYSSTHKYLSDSNVDWGQDAERAVVAARAEMPGAPAFAYFGTTPPSSAELVSVTTAIDLITSGDRVVLISYSLLSITDLPPIRPPDRDVGGSVALWLPPSK